MKKFFKVIGILILLLIVVVLVAGLFMPKEMNVQRSMAMNAPKNVVFDEIRHFKTWPAWSAWLQMDPEAELEYFGIDGEPGSGYNWKGKKVGSGTMKNAGINGTAMSYDLSFKGFWESKADGIIKAEEQGTGTNVIWTFHSIMSYPWNGLGLFMNMEKRLGDDFNTGLTNLKKIVEAKPAPLPAPATVNDTTTATPPPVAN